MLDRMFTRHQDGVDALEEGEWLIQRRQSRRVDIPVRIWFGPPSDPDTGDLLDRSPRWQILIGGARFEDGEQFRNGAFRAEWLGDFWPSCKTDPITAHEYAYRIERQEWAQAYDPDDAFAVVGGRIDAMTARLPFGD